MTLTEELRWRGFVNQTTYKDITVLDGPPVSFYWGVDPSAPSMTIGNLAAAMMVYHFIKHGHKAFLLVGGATGLIGDPDGKAEERELKPVEEIETNKQALVNQYQNLFKGQDFEIVDNYDWFKNMGYLQFLREVGKHVPLRQMVNRDFVQARASEDGAGISYAEFSYSLIQGYDFLHLFREKGVTLQVAASDQWGNSIAGVELIRRITGQEAHVWTSPLVINKATGVKFGKTESGAIWLDSGLTTPFQFYQFWLNVDDEGVEDYLKIYTLLGKEEIDAIMAYFDGNRAGRHAQRELAYEVTKLVHGKAKADSVKRVTNSIFNGEGLTGTQLEAEDFEWLRQELPSVEASAGTDIIQILVKTGLAASNSDAMRAINEDSIYISGQRLSSLEDWSKAQYQHGFFYIRRGKNKLAIVKLT